MTNGSPLHRLTLVCDVCEAQFSRAVSADSPAEASHALRREAFRLGWRFRNGRDQCPNCAPERSDP